jgi:hypothetical protein
VRYRVTTGTLTVQARSRVHDTTTVWSKITGDIVADPDTLAGATARFEVDMTAFDAGDSQNRSQGLRHGRASGDVELRRSAMSRDDRVQQERRGVLRGVERGRSPRRAR